jgi:hypothetical protein
MHSANIDHGNITFYIYYQQEADNLYLVKSDDPFFLETFGETEVRVPLSEFLEERTAGEYGPVIFPATPAEFALQAIARKILADDHIPE